MPKPTTGSGKVKLVKQGHTAAKLYGTDPQPNYPVAAPVRELKP